MSTSKARLQHPMITCYRISDLCIRMLLVFVILFGTVHTINEDNVQLSTSTLVKPQILIPANAEMNFPKQSALTAD